MKLSFIGFCCTVVFDNDLGRCMLLYVVLT